MQRTIPYIKKELKGHYPESEIRSFIRLIMEFTCGVDYTQMILHSNRIINSNESKMIREIVSRLKKYEPIQYIFEEAVFYNLKLKVTPDVLIPRFETEELVHWILETINLKNQLVLDIGTGSGCMALALAKHIKEARIEGVDISPEAINIARQNARINKLFVSFFNADILNWRNYKWNSYSLIVSNPPYVKESERLQMQPNVLNFEPSGALFVSDDNPLLFYQKIGVFAQSNLMERGWLFFEFNEHLGDEMKLLMSQLGFKRIEIKKDVNGKNRFLRCLKE